MSIHRLPPAKVLRPSVASPAPPTIQAELLTIRGRLEFLAAGWHATAAALRAQAANADLEYAITAQRMIGDMIDMQIERLAGAAKEHSTG